MRKHFLRFLGLSLVIAGLSAPEAYSWGECQACWAVCSTDEDNCRTWCQGCPQPGTYTFASGGYVACGGGGVSQCQTDCHYEGLACLGSCC
jgi:hypothetical protein